MSEKRHVLVISDQEDSEFRLPVGFNYGECGIRAVRDSVTGIADAVANTPRIVIVALDDASQALKICQKIVDYTTPECRPTLVISGTLASDADLPSTDDIVTASLGDQERLSNPNDEWSECEPERISCHGLELDRPRMRAMIDGRGLALTVTEFLLLWTLAVSPGYVKSRAQLLEAWRGTLPASGLRTVDQHIRSIRKKMGIQGDMIETVRSRGYRFRDCQNLSIETGRITCDSTNDKATTNHGL